MKIFSASLIAITISAALSCSVSLASEHSQSHDLLAERPALVFLYAGSAYAKEFNSPRGHQFAVADVSQILRSGAGSKDKGDLGASCWSCKSYDVIPLMEKMGSEGFAAHRFADIGPQVNNTIHCQDCHQSDSEKLALPRPHAQHAMNKAKLPFAEQSTQMQSSQLCGQCHVAYYFQPEKNNAVNIPWIFGNDADKIEQYFDTRGFYDWLHPLSKVPVIKARHPEFEHWSRSAHAELGVGCVDCHMGTKIDPTGKIVTDHEISASYKNFKTQCQQCHESEVQLEQQIRDNKAKIENLRTALEDQLIKAHIEAKTAWDHGLTWEQLGSALMDIRHAQWRWDFAISSHGVHVHNSKEAFALLSRASQQINMGRAKLAALLPETKITYPTLTTKAEAQAFIGLDLPKLEQEKQQFIEQIIKTQWPKISH